MQPERDLDEGPPGKRRGRHEGRINGREGDDLIAGVTDCPTGNVQAADKAGDPDQPFFLGMEIVRLVKVFQQSGRKLRRRMGIAEDTVGDPLLERLNDGRRGAKIHIR